MSYIILQAPDLILYFDRYKYYQYVINKCFKLLYLPFNMHYNVIYVYLILFRPYHKINL